MRDRRQAAPRIARGVHIGDGCQQSPGIRVRRIEEYLLDISLLDDGALPQISRLISALEDEVGFPLFMRQGRGLVPTQECLHFYESTRHILEGFEEVSRIAEAIRSNHEQWLHIVAQPYFAYSVMPLAEKKVLTPADISGQPFIALRPSTFLRQHMDELIEKKRLSLRIVAETSSGQSACQLAALGMGIALSDPVLASNVNGIELRDLEPALHMDYGFLLPSHYAPSELAQTFARIVTEVVKDSGAERVLLRDRAWVIKAPA